MNGADADPVEAFTGLYEFFNLVERFRGPEVNNFQVTDGFSQNLAQQVEQHSAILSTIEGQEDLLHVILLQGSF